MQKNHSMKLEHTAGANLVDAIRDVNRRLRALEALTLTLDENSQFKLPGFFSISVCNVEISSGKIAPTSSFALVNTEENASSDNLDTISGGSQGDLLILVAYDDTNTVVVRDGIDNIYLGQSTVSLDEDKHALLLVCTGEDWLELSNY